MINKESEYTILGISRELRRNFVIGGYVLLLVAISGLVSVVIYQNKVIEVERNARLKDKDDSWSRALKQAELNGDKSDILSQRTLILSEQINELTRQIEAAKKIKK